MIDEAITWLPTIGAWCGFAAVFLKKARKAAPKSTNHKWAVQVVTDSQINREENEGLNDSPYSYMRTTTHSYHYGDGPKKTLRSDYALVRVVRGTTEVLRLGAIAVGDPEFVTKLAELRGVAEERAMTLNAT